MLKSEYVYYRGHKVSYDSLKKHSMIPIDIICDECGKSFQSTKYQLIRNGHELCQQCALRLKSEKVLPIGEKYNRLTVLEKGKHGGYSVCRCDCGTVREFNNFAIKSGKTKSCGCLQKEKASTHFRELHKIQINEHHPNWKGGTTPLRNKLESTKKYKDMREYFLDCYSCMCCGSDIDLRIHHKVAFCKDSSLFMDENNIVVLCESCHRKYHNIYGYEGDDNLFEEFIDKNIN